MRLFFAAWPPPGTAAALHEWGEAARQIAGGKLVAEQNIHLTLAFLGEADAATATAAAKRARGARHVLPIEKAHFWRDNDILWVGPRETPPALGALVKSLHLELYRAEFVLDRRPFASHVTLLRKARAPKSLPPLPAAPWPVDEFVLVSSRVSAKGATYEPVARFPL